MGLADVALSEFTIYPEAAEAVTDTPEAHSYLVRVCQKALDEAYAAAPYDTGRYRESLFASGVDPIHGEHRQKQAAILGAGVFYWHWIEFGTINMQPYHVLENAVRSVCEVYVPIPKSGAAEGD
jgi:HK97 gp10 family phage protein